jgi:hypothetical protein
MLRDNTKEGIAHIEAYAILNNHLGFAVWGSALTRFVLIDEKNRVCGDSAELALRSRDWAEIAAAQDGNIEEMAIRAARLLDKNRNSGHAGQAYEFVPFAGGDDANGYFIFDCTGDRAPPAIREAAHGLDATVAVMTACFYRGFVRCRH